VRFRRTVRQRGIGLVPEGQSEEGFCAAALEVRRRGAVGEGGEDDGRVFRAALLDEIVARVSVSLFVVCEKTARESEDRNRPAMNLIIGTPPVAMNLRNRFWEKVQCWRRQRLPSPRRNLFPRSFMTVSCLRSGPNVLSPS
jgi:hypothetical protein